MSPIAIVTVLQIATLIHPKLNHEGIRQCLEGGLVCAKVSVAIRAETGPGETEFSTWGDHRDIQLTERGQKFFEMISETPLPVPVTPQVTWKDPRDVQH